MRFGLVSGVIVLASLVPDAQPHDQLRHYQNMAVVVASPGGTGTGTVIRNDESGILILTAAHVLETSLGWYEPTCTIKHQMYASGGRLVGTLSVQGRVIGFSGSASGHDLALVHVKDKGLAAILKGFAPVRTASLPLPLGYEFIHVGNMAGLYDSVSHGHISHQHRIISGPSPWKDGAIFYQLDGTSAGGSSGGPLFDADGQLCGVLVGGLHSGDSIGLAVPSWRVMQWIAETNSLWAVDHSLPVPEQEE